MEHEERYMGRRFVVTTRQTSAGEWWYSAETADTLRRAPLVEDPETLYSSEEAAARAGVSAAAGAIDRARTTRGKP
jgi:hypothetical protein